MQNFIKVKRQELKYYINYHEYLNIKNQLKQIMQRDQYQTKDAGYFIRSLYFDDINNAAITEKLAGIPIRSKYRLRIYKEKQDLIKIERKTKNQYHVIKDTGIISKEQAKQICNKNYNVLLENKNKNLNSIYFDMKQKYFRPVVIVDYIRDAYLLKYNQIRITFDKEIKIIPNKSDIFNFNLKTIPVFNPNIIILEIKYNHFLPEFVKKTLNLKNFVRSSISKYCTSRLSFVNRYL